MKNTPSTVVILGTGGTIAGTAASAADNLGYTAAQLGVAQLLAAVPQLVDVLPDTPIEVQQIAQIDSKDMSFSLWQKLAENVSAHLLRDEVCGVVITHGSDTLEETAYFLQRVLAPTKPVVLVAAMRPATSLQADGPQNLLDAACVARNAHASGVVVVMAGRVHSALDVRKCHTHRLDAFDSGDAGVVAQVQNGRVHQYRAWPTSSMHGLARLPRPQQPWPVVEIVTSYAGSSGVLIEALVNVALVQGLVVASTGNGTVHHRLEAALLTAQAAGITVLRSTRCLSGGALEAEAASHKFGAFMSAGTLTPVQARIELMLQLLAKRVA
jgi:L-asparaginase